MCWSWKHRWTLLNRMSRSTCRFRSERGWTQETMLGSLTGNGTCGDFYPIENYYKAKDVYMCTCLAQLWGLQNQLNSRGPKRPCIVGWSAHWRHLGIWWIDLRGDCNAALCYHYCSNLYLPFDTSHCLLLSCNTSSSQLASWPHHFMQTTFFCTPDEVNCLTLICLH